PLAEPALVRPRETGVEYDIDERDGVLYIHTNDTHENFRLATAPLGRPGDWTTLIEGSDAFYLTGSELFRDFPVLQGRLAGLGRPGEWTTLIEGSDAFYLTGFELFRDFYVIEGRLGGLDRLEVRYYADPARIEPVEFPEASYTAAFGNNPEFDQTVLRVSYESMVSPASTYDYDVRTRELALLKVQEIPSGYDGSLYATERLEIPARDGTAIPVSIMYRKDRQRPGAMHLYGYDAYGIAIPPGLSTTRLTLVDRGFAYAIAHIRGGDDLGRAWYKAGKLERRTNAFDDFVDVARGLIAGGYTEKGRISISGGSAGGELMGAVINSDPELWGAVVAHVPFVDVLATMLDATLPLTPGEWPEWGNPIEDKAAFELIRSY